AAPVAPPWSWSSSAPSFLDCSLEQPVDKFDRVLLRVPCGRGELGPGILAAGQLTQRPTQVLRCGKDPVRRRRRGRQIADKRPLAGPVASHQGLSGVPDASVARHGYFIALKTNSGRR